MLRISSRNFSTTKFLKYKLPPEFVTPLTSKPKLREPLSPQVINTLKRVSLIDTYDETALKNAIALAEQIEFINTDNVEPLVTLLEDFPLTLREDCVTEGFIKKLILQNAEKVEEDYFVGPPGNIPLEFDNK